MGTETDELGVGVNPLMSSESWNSASLIWTSLVKQAFESGLALLSIVRHLRMNSWLSGETAGVSGNVRTAVLATLWSLKRC